MRERRERGEPVSDLLGCLMQSRGDDGAPLLTDEQVADNIIGVLFAAQDTTASVLTWIIKFLRDHPKLLEAVRAEQAAVREATGGGRRPLTWAHARSMALTHRVRAVFSCGFTTDGAPSFSACSQPASHSHPPVVQVILESLRMASIISFTFREAVADVEYKGTHVRAAGCGRRGASYVTEERRALASCLILTRIPCVPLACRVPYPQGVEGDAALQEHPSQPGLLPGSTQVRPF